MARVFMIVSIVKTVVFGILIIPIFLGISNLIKYFTTNYIIDETKVTKNTGLLTTVVEEIRFNRIESVVVQQPFLGKIFGYGNIAITGAGNSKMLILNVEKPKEYKLKLDAKLD